MVPNVYIWTTEARVHNLLKSVQCPFTQNPIDHWLAMTDSEKIEAISKYNDNYLKFPEEDVLRSWEMSDLSLMDIDTCVKQFSKALQAFSQDPRKFITKLMRFPISNGYEPDIEKPDPYREDYKFGDHLYCTYLVKKQRNGWLWLNNLDVPRARTMYAIVSRMN
jgi:hypothetical protein